MLRPQTEAETEVESMAQPGFGHPLDPSLDHRSPLFNMSKTCIAKHVLVSKIVSLGEFWLVVGLKWDPTHFKQPSNRAKQIREAGDP